MQFLPEDPANPTHRQTNNSIVNSIVEAKAPTTKAVFYILEYYLKIHKPILIIDPKLSTTLQLYT